MTPEFNITQQVRLIADPEQRVFIITKYEVSIGSIGYCLAHGREVSWHFGFEIEPYNEKPGMGLTNR